MTMRKIELDDDETTVARRRMLDMSKVELIRLIERLERDLRLTRLLLQQAQFKSPDNDKNVYVTRSNSTSTASIIDVTYV
jgi:hypothetical protein